MLQNATPLRKSAPSPPNSSNVSCTAPACRSSSNVPRLPSFLEMLQKFCSLLTRCTIPCACLAKRSKSGSVHGVFCTFWLRNVLPATTACTFSTSQLPKVIRAWWVLYILTWKCASRHNGVQFFIFPAGSAPAALASLLFDSPEPQIIRKTQCFATFLPFRTPASSFFWLFLFSDLLSYPLLFSLTVPISACHLSILSEVWLLNDF